MFSFLGTGRRLTGVAARFACLALLLALRMAAVAPAQDVASSSHQAWSTEEGLPQASVHQVFQARDGYLWLATEGGVVRFDGITFKTLSHESDPAFTSDDVSAIAQDGGGALWFGTADGLIRSSGTALRRFGEADGLPAASIVSLATGDDGRLLVLTTRGVALSDGAAFRAVQDVSANVTSMERAPDGSVWLLSAQGAMKYQGGRFAHVSLPFDPEPALRSVQFGPEGAVWARTSQAVTLSMPQLRRTWKIGRDLQGSRVEMLFVDRAGVAWIGTNHGLFTVTPHASAQVQSVDALGGDSVLCGFEDREGNHWIGTESSGLHALRPRTFTSAPGAGGLAITAVVQDRDGAVWLGTREDGLVRLRSGRADVPVAPSALTSPVILSLAPGDDGDVWAGTPDGLNHVKNGVVHTYTSADGLPDDFVRSILVDAEGVVWVGTRFGLAQLQGDKIRTFTHADGLASDSVGPLLTAQTTIASRTVGDAVQKELCIGTAAGLSCVRGGRIESFSSRDGLQGSIITALAQDSSGAIWAGVHGAGLSRFEGGRSHPIVSRDLPEEISALAVDRANVLWLRAKRGVYRVPIEPLERCVRDENCKLPVNRYGVIDGMPSDELTAEGSPVIWQSAAGALLFATRKGLAVADPLHLPTNTVAPPVVIQRLTVDGQDQRFTSGDLRIVPGHSRYSFDYAGLSYTIPGSVRYRYMLEGFDRDWVDAGARRTAYYTNLPPGRYSFHVLAENNDGVWNRTGAYLRFRILPPFYRRWWFYVLALLVIGGAVFLAFQLRLRDERRRFSIVLDERNRVAREIHDTLAQDLVSVSLHLEIASQLVAANKGAEAREQIQETRSLVKQGLEAARQSIWNLRANVAGNSLPTRLSAAFGQIATSHPSSRIKIGGAYRPLPAEIENEVFRIAQESLSNIQRHAAATQVLVELLYDRARLLLTIRDDGRGFSPEAAQEMQGHYGLRGMQERAGNLQGDLTIDSNPGEGTTVTLVVPLKATEGSRTW